MGYNENGTYLENYGQKEKVKPIREELLREGIEENKPILYAENMLEVISLKVMNCFIVGTLNEKFIQESLLCVQRKLTPKIIEQYTWWIPCIEREGDLMDEYINNKDLYNTLLIEAKLCLQELVQFKNGYLPGNSQDLLNGGRYEEHYANILHQMNKIITINNSIKIRLDPPDFV